MLLSEGLMSSEHGAWVIETGLIYPFNAINGTACETPLS